jgi:hypothetical protein
MDLYTVPLASGDTASFTVDYMPEDFEGELGLSPHITQYDIEGNVVDSYPLIEYLARSDSDRYVGNSNLRLTPAEIDEIAEQVRDEFNLSMDEVESTQGYDTMVGNTGFNEAGFTEIEGFYDNPAAARAAYQSENDNLIVPAGLSEDASTGGEIFARPRVGDGQWQYFELGTNPEGDTGITVFDAYGDGTIEVNDFFAVPNVDTDNMAEAVDQYLTTGAVDTSANQTVVEGVDQRYVGWPADQEFQRLMPGDTDAFPVPPDARVNTMGDLNSASRSPAGTTFVPFNEQGSIDSFVNPYESNEWFQSDIYETEIALFNTDTNQVVAEMPMLPLDREGLEFVDGEYGGPLDELARAQVQPVPSTRSLRVSANEVVAEMDGTLHADGTWISDAVPDVYGDGEPAVYAIPSRQMGDNRPLLYTYWDGEDMDAPQIQIREQDQNFDWNVDEIVYLEDLDMTEDQLLAGGLHNYVTSNYEVARQERQQAAQAPLAWEGPVERKTPRPAHSGYSTGVARGYGERALLQPGDKYYGDRVHLASITDPETGRAVSEGLLSMSREGWGSAVGEERMWLVDEIQSPRQKAAGTHGWWDDPRGPVEEAIAGIMGPIDPSRMSDPEQQAMRQVLELQEKRVPPTPMREGGRWVEQQTKRGLRDAVSRNADIFGWNTAENITDRWGTSGALFNKIYDQVAPKMKLWKRLGVKPERMTNNAGREVWGVRLTPELKERLIKEGIPYYTLGGMAILGSQYGEEEEGMLFSPAI